MRAGLFVVLALVTTGCVGTRGADTTETAPPTTSSGATTTTTTPEYSWQAGDCFGFTLVHDLDLLPYAPYGDDDLVSCDEAHTHEVLLAGEVAEGADDPFPGDELSVRVAGVCTEAFAEHVGVDARDSWYELIFYLPDADEWAAGERYLACVLYRLDQRGLVRELRGTVAGDPAAATWPVERGDCLRGAVAEPRYGGPVPCDGPHTYEVVADLVHPGGHDEPYPGSTAVRDAGDDLCAAAYEAAAGDAGDPRVAVSPRFVGRADWDAGYRRLLCVAWVFSADGELMEGRGSLLDGSWEPAGVYRDEPALTA